ncbi:uncharacterized protein [Euphorbia lathyris]|uniref:uncharacterized protein isoform X2 n=1 Tax=Euphorbia lathyris TaxID=212925 RepID=UPI00331386F7
MEAYFSQFGTIKRLRIATSKKTGKSKHYGFIEFEDSEVNRILHCTICFHLTLTISFCWLQVAEVVTECMHNYLLFEHLLQVHLIPPEKVHPKLWKGFNLRFKPLDRVQAERKRQNKDRTLEEHKKLVEKIIKRDQKRRKRIEAVGIEYECPQIVCDIQPAPKRIKFDED